MRQSTDCQESFAMAKTRQCLSASISIVIALILACSSFTQDTTTAKAPRISPSTDEVRALWVVRTTLTSTEKIRRMVESAKAAGFNTIIVQVRGRGDAYYRSRWEPRAV